MKPLHVNFLALDGMIIVVGLLLFCNAHARYFIGFWSQRHLFKISKQATKDLRKSWWKAAIQKELSLRNNISLLIGVGVSISAYVFRNDPGLKQMGLSDFYAHLAVLFLMVSIIGFLIGICQSVLHTYWGDWINTHPGEMQQCEDNYLAQQCLKARVELDEQLPKSNQENEPSPPKRL